MCKYKIDFHAVNQNALNNALPILQRWLPDGQLRGYEYVALNPTRADKKLGSFSINITTGKWGDFSTGERGGDMISLTSYLFALQPYNAAKRLCRMLGMEVQHDA